MLLGKKIVVALPAYNAAKTLKATYHEIPLDIVDEVVLVDDDSQDNTVNLARELGIRNILRHTENIGYGGNQKTCYNKAMDLGADIIILLHPDYQYTPKLIPAMASIIANDVYPVVLGSRILGRGAKIGGMPLYKFVSNRILTLLQNWMLGQKLSEYHTGFRAYSREVLFQLDYQTYSNSFLFDNQILVHIFDAGFQVAEITCPTKYTKESSSINFGKSVVYGLGVLWESFKYMLYRMKLLKKNNYSVK